MSGSLQRAPAPGRDASRRPPLSSATAQPLPRAWRPTPLIVASLGLHVAALLAWLAWPHTWPWLAGLVLANHGVLTLLGLWPRSHALGSNWTRLPDAVAARGAVAITIDDGPDPDVTPRVLELLEREGVKATFFVVGAKAAAHPSLCRAIAASGHAIENHTMHHPLRFALLGIRGMAREASQAQAAIAAAVGMAPRFFRAPAGLRSPLLEPALARIGLQLASWTRRGFDTRERDAERVLARLLRNLGAGDILLLHDGNAARTAAGVPVILAVLPSLLAALRRKRLTPITLREAL